MLHPLPQATVLAALFLCACSAELVGGDRAPDERPTTGASDAGPAIRFDAPRETAVSAPFGPDGHEPARLDAHAPLAPDGASAPGPDSGTGADQGRSPRLDARGFETIWYVDNAASGLNSGRSWADAWQRFVDIDWSLVAPGHVVMISGGTEEKTYRETLEVGTSGAEGRPIAILAATDPGHDGRVIIDGEDARAEGIRIRPRQHLVLSGFKLHGHTRYEIYVSGASGSSYSASGASSAIVIERMEIFTRARGVFIQTSDRITVRDCQITTPDYSTNQTDGIYSQRNHENHYDHNTIVIYNTEPNGHDDCIQMYQDTSITVSNNYIGQVNDKSGNAQGIYATTMHGTTRYLNNVVNLGNAQSNGLSFRRLDGTGTVEFIGNTVYSIRAYHTAMITETPDPLVKNNIFFTSQAGTALDLTGWSGDASRIDHNLYWAAGSDVASLNGSSRSWSAWRSAGFDARGLHADPEVSDIGANDFHLRPTSPAIDRGADLGPSHAIDRDGVTRPRGAGWDIGAYEQ